MRTYRHVLLASGLTSVINGLLYPIMALYMYGISEDFFLVGLITALPFLAAVPMSFVWGAISDRIASRRLVMAVAGTVGGALFFAMPFVGTTELIILRLVQVGFTTSFVLLNAVATECFPKKKGTSVGNLALIGGIGQAIGALAAGFLLPSSEMSVGSDAVTIMFSVAGIITIIGALSLLPMRERRKKSLRTRFKGILSFGEKRAVAIVTSVALVLPLAGYIVFSVFPIYLGDLDIPWDATMVAGAFTALSAVTGIFASGIAGWACDRHGRKWVLVGSGAAYVLVWALMGMTVEPILIAMLWAIPVWSFMTVSAFTMVSDLTKPSERGRGIGLVNSAINLGGAAGSVLAGYLLAREMVSNIFFLAAAVSVIGMLVALLAKETLQRQNPSS
ncbi:MAG: MFS transporter [Thermoplasmata archaeon]|nr:MFS transporter [Thermoplasmata archaeon]